LKWVKSGYPQPIDVPEAEINSKTEDLLDAARIFKEMTKESGSDVYAQQGSLGQHGGVHEISA
jgi:hypothetical protein